MENHVDIDKSAICKTYKGLEPVDQKSIHTIAYLNFLENNFLSMKAKFVWLHFSARKGTNGYVWFSKGKSSNTLNMDKDTYSKYVNELETEGGLIQFKRISKCNGSPDTNIVIPCEYNQFDERFIIPKNIDAVINKIYEKFGDTHIIEKCIPIPKKNNTPIPKKSTTPIPNNSTTPIPKESEALGENIGIAPVEEIGITPPNKSDTLGEEIGTNNNKLNNQNSNDKNINNEKENNNTPIIKKELVAEFIQGALKLASQSINEIGFNTWITPNFGQAYYDELKSIIIVPCENKFTKEIVEARYIDIFSDYIKQLSNKEFKIEAIEINKG